MNWVLVVLGAMIGDPLYRPYQAHPAIRVEDLQENVRRAVGKD